MWEWVINPPLPVPSWGVGQSPSLEDAKTAFKAAWVWRCCDAAVHDVLGAAEMEVLDRPGGIDFELVDLLELSQAPVPGIQIDVQHSQSLEVVRQTDAVFVDGAHLKILSP